MAQSKELDVVIIGAGSTGLLLAQGLKMNGIKSTVYEREDAEMYQVRPREWGMTLHWGSNYIKKCIPTDLQDKLNDAICCDPYHKDKDLTLPHYDGMTGEKLFDTPGDNPRRISRKKLRNFLSQGLDVQYGKKISGIARGPDQTVVATFVDGTTASGTLLVGCDGANSVVREVLVGKETAQVEDLDLQIFNVSTRFPPDVARLQRMGHPVFKNSYHRDGFCWWQSIQDLPDPDRPETWMFQNTLSWIGAPRPEDFPDSASRLAFWRSKAERFAEPWRSVAPAFPDDLQFGTDRIIVWKPSMDWSKGELGGIVTISGDAAHPMPPFRGQGLNNALQDATVLVDQLVAVAKGEKSLGVAVEEYEKEMKERAMQEIPISVMQSLMIHNWETLNDAPFFKMGMRSYKDHMEAKGEPIEVATQAKAL